MNPGRSWRVDCRKSWGCSYRFQTGRSCRIVFYTPAFLTLKWSWDSLRDPVRLQTLIVEPISTPSGEKDLTQSDYGNQCGLFTAGSHEMNDGIIHRVKNSGSQEWLHIEVKSEHGKSTHAQAHPQPVYSTSGSRTHISFLCFCFYIHRPTPLSMLFVVMSSPFPGIDLDTR